jgi:CDP-glucose 4,6-dehydratase
VEGVVTMSSSLKAFKGKRVFLTGHTGFKGGWLALWLSSLGAEVTGFALAPNTEPNLFEVAAVGSRVQHIIGDIRDGAALSKAMRDSRAEFVMHLAAQPLVRLSYSHPKETFDTNVGGTVNLLEAARQTSTVRSIVVVTSDKCYDNREWVWGYRESDAMGGHDPYSASKGCTELVVAAYMKSFFKQESGVGLATVRAGNVVGGGDWALDRIVPDCMRALSRGAVPGIRNPYAIRPWQHVLEPLYGYMMIADKLATDPINFSGAWNFGPLASNCRTVREVADAVVKSWGAAKWDDLSSKHEGDLHEARYLRLCCDKAMSYLKWTPQLDFEKTIEVTVEWYKSYYRDPAASAANCMDQIKHYSSLVAH